MLLEGLLGSSGEGYMPIGASSSPPPQGVEVVPATVQVRRLAGFLARRGYQGSVIYQTIERVLDE